PEQVVGGACDRRTDIYTLGVVAYEAIAGVRPFADAHGPTALMTALLTSTPPALATRRPAIPAALDALVGRCLAREPEDRFATVHELAAAIDRLLDDGARWGQTRRCSRRTRLTLAAATTLAVAASAALWLA
ncbi:MAG: hypothetical protein NT062_23560, partial [Proteobacteria bacterium]|nr:hypothetical protein [Pseudomonadota bacterium]